MINKIKKTTEHNITGRTNRQTWTGKLWTSTRNKGNKRRKF